MTYKYHIVSVYYKSGEYVLDICDTEESLRQFILSEIYVSETYDNKNAISNLDTVSLCNYAIANGADNIRREIGYGIVAIYHGTLISS
jgi:hypothetical protein